MNVAAKSGGSRQLGTWARRAFVAAACLVLAGCNFDLGGEAKYPVPRQKPGSRVQYEQEAGVFGEGGIFGPDLPQDQGGGGIGVNNLLWRASLDTVSFMPLVSADPFGGVIITDWYTPPSAPDERFKVNIYILGRALRADGIRASVFRQQIRGSTWVDAPVALNTATDLENAILTRARQMRLAGSQ
ncbi:DUF3576 domain-containing protein [Dongia deserti]|uniref:DUF3576 domain-containing protein n=1 Tax=Dongia deserti TaxID=2268030 RepID=UPI000E64F059|nr:DUF3576 domain-containing protein [Dongia deserti]